MKTFYCGYNGFGQFPGKEKDSFSLYNPTLFPFDVVFASCAWNRICYSNGSEVYLSGLIGGESGKLEKLTIPEGKLITDVSCSRSNILAIAEDGGCWMYQHSGGWKNISDLLKAEVDSHVNLKEILSPEISSNEHKIIKVCCGDNMNLAVCNLGQVYSVPSPLLIPRKKVMEVACGFDHCLALTDDSIVYSWGLGRRGQLGHEVLEDEESPRELEMLSGLQVTNISAGGWHSIALTRSGDAYVWGWNSSGQLGLPCRETRERITDGIVCSMSCVKKDIPCSSSRRDSKVRTSSSSLRDKKGMTSSSSKGDTKERTSTSSQEDTIEIASGSSQGDAKEMDSSGQENPKEMTLSSSKREVKISSIQALPIPIHFPLLDEGKLITAASCGSRHTVILTDDGTAWGCGWNAYGQLGLTEWNFYENLTKVTIPGQEHSKIVKIVCGSWSTLLFVED